MTTIAPSIAEPASAVKRSAPRSPAHLSFGGVLRSERIKLSSLRSIRITLIITILAGLGLSALMALVLVDQVSGGTGGAEAALGYQSYLVTVSAFAAPFLALIFGVLGVFAVASEYSSGMILSTLAAVPARTPVYVAKALVTAAIAAITAIVIVAGGLAIAVGFMPESLEEIASPSVVSGALGAVAYLVLITMLAFGVAAMLRSTAGGIAVIAGITFVLPIAFQMLMMSNWEWVPVVASYLPADLGSTLGSGLPADDAVAPMHGAPGYWGALGAMTAWATIAVIPAAIIFKRRDAK
ncbi:ABC transporter permease subunit [Leucobacter sp. GX24907]